MDQLIILDTAPDLGLVNNLDHEFEGLWESLAPKVILNPEYIAKRSETHGAIVLSTALRPIIHKLALRPTEVILIEALDGDGCGSLEGMLWAVRKARNISAGNRDRVAIQASWGASDGDWELTAPWRYEALLKGYRPLVAELQGFLGDGPDRIISCPSGNDDGLVGHEGRLPDADHDVCLPWVELCGPVKTGDFSPETPRKAFAIASHGPDWIKSPWSSDGPEVWCCMQGGDLMVLTPAGWRRCSGTSFASPAFLCVVWDDSYSSVSKQAPLTESALNGTQRFAVNDAGATTADPEVIQWNGMTHDLAYGWGTMQRQYDDAAAESPIRPGWMGAGIAAVNDPVNDYSVTLWNNAERQRRAERKGGLRVSGEDA